MRSLLVIIGKDLRLMLRDRPALLFIVIAPIIVTSVAGMSLSGLYGSGLTGDQAYLLPIADEDGGELGRRIEEQLAGDARLRIRQVGTRLEAERLVRDKLAGSALVIPAGTAAAITENRPASLLLYTDPVKYLERLNVRVRILEMRDELAYEERARILKELFDQRERLREELDRFAASVARVRTKAEDLDEEINGLRAQASAEMNREAARLQADVARQIADRIDALASEVNEAVAARVSALRQPAHAYLDALEQSRRSFEEWFEELRRLANRRADDIPPPPEFPEPPPELIVAIDKPPESIALPARLEISVELSPLVLPELSATSVIDAELPALEVPMPVPQEGELRVEEISVDGASTTINAFDQNVPGFSITFLLLGMLLGISLGVLDERDWGTFDRIRALPLPARNILIGKLVTRFGIGVVQMIVLFAAGYFFFDVSLGPEPWALLLPIAGIAFAGTAFGLVVAAVARSRDSILPLGTIGIVTMAAIGGCWWPIDLEPLWMRQVALAFPTTWAMEAFNDLMIRSRDIDAVLRPTVVLFAFGLGYLLIGLWLFRRRVANS